MADRPDSGLQAERTALSWQRTALSAAGTAALLLRLGEVNGRPELLVAGSALVAVALASYLVGRARTRRVGEALAAQRSAAQPRPLFGLCLAVALVAGVVLVSCLI